MPSPAATRFLAPLLALALVPAFGAPIAAQTVPIDDGSFRLLVGGREVGTETFTIRQSGSGVNAVVIARGSVTLDTAGVPEELTSSLQVAGPSLRPAAYEITVRGAESERIAGRVVGARFSARILSPTGEQMREYLASEGAVLVDEGVAHHYFFLARRVEGASARIPVIIPRQSRQVSAEVTSRGRETITVGRQEIAATHLVVTPAGSSERHLWVDAEGRVLRLEIPSLDFVAHRTAPPR